MNTAKQITFSLFLVFVLISCVKQQEIITVVPVLAIDGTQSITPTSHSTSTPPLIASPLPTIPVSTLNAVATLDAIRAGLIGQKPELEEYGTSCSLYDCSGVEMSPNGQYVIFSNGNLIELFSIDGRSLGKYSFYDIYGNLIDLQYGYVSNVHWSKDGKYMYVASQFGDGGPEAYFGYKSSLARVNLENGTWKDTGISGLISFSPDEKYIIYSTNNSEVRIRDLQSGQENIYFSEDYYHYFGNFVWSTNGEKCIFVATPEDWHAENVKYALYVIDLRSSKASKVYESNFPFYYPVDWIALNKVRLNNFQEFGKWTLDLSTTPPQITP